jgi:hypothetical protein
MRVDVRILKKANVCENLQNCCKMQGATWGEKNLAVSILGFYALENSIYIV